MCYAFILPTELPRDIFRVGFKQLLYVALYIDTMLQLTAEPRGRPVASSMYEGHLESNAHSSI